MRADAGACGPKMRGHRLRNCTKYVFCAFSQVAGATGGEAFLCAGVGGRRPSPPQRASTSCASPAPGGGGGREGEGARAAGGSAGGRRTRQQTGTARNRREPPRAGGGAAGAPPPRNGPRAAEGGNGGPRPPVWALARQGGCRGCRDRPGAARERPRRGRGQATADPRQRRGLPMRPTLFAPAQTPGGGEHGAGGARSGGQGGGSRRKAGPQLRPPDAPLQEAPSPRDAVRRKRRAPRLSKPGRSPR